MALNPDVGDLKYKHILGKFGYLYRAPELRILLQHYGVEPVSPLKSQLLLQLSHLETSQNVTASDRRRIINDLRYPRSRRTRPPILAQPPPPNAPPATPGIGHMVIVCPLREAQRQKMLDITREHAAQAYEGPIQECCICCEEFLAEDFPQSVTSACAHEEEMNVCFACCAGTIKARVEGGQWRDIFCPICPARLSFEDINRLATQDTFARYDRYITLQALEIDPKFRMCMSSNCNSGQLQEETAECVTMTCHSCNLVICTNHNLPWHTNQTCEEFDAYETRRTQRIEQEAASEAFLVSAAVKRCPGRDCGIPLEKNAGCDHFTCTRCRHEFCWLCLADFRVISRLGRNGYRGHETSCPYYRTNYPANALHNPDHYLNGMNFYALPRLIQV